MSFPVISAGHEEAFILGLPDGFKLYGAINRPRENAAGKLLVIAHGLGGFTGEYMHQMAARYFIYHGYDVVRLSFYSPEPDARRLSGTTLAQQVQDLQAVLSHFADGYDKVYVAGHSYGGMTTLIANPDIEAVSLWDSSLYPYTDFWARESRVMETCGCTVLDYGYEAVVSPEMIAEGQGYDWDKVQALAEAMRAPTQIIVAGAHIKRPGQKQVYDVLPAPKDYITIDGADHEFVNGDTVYQLLDNTRLWFERF